MKAIAFLALLVLAAPLAQAGCPNSCSGHGTCGEFDMCTCHHNWQGGDCSERVCLYHNAWVTTPNGDLNHDGDITDGTIYSPNYYFTAGSSSNFLQTQQAAGGTWEQWPSTHHATLDEGHFYQECSNRGKCNRGTGICKCFEGYEGDHCQRTTCNKKCNGHGRCRSINQLANDWEITPVTYNLWDKDMMYTCDCDAGYMGADCTERICPYGDDPLTKNQVTETQWIDVRSKCTLGGTDCDGSLGGTIKVSFKDHLGSTYTTDAVTVAPMDDGTAAHATATALEAALEALPNGALPDVTVTAQFCETTLPGKFKDFAKASAGADNYAGTEPAYLRCPGRKDSSNILGAHLVVKSSDATVVLNTHSAAGGGTYEATAVASGINANEANDVTCNGIVYEQCIRYRVDFTGLPGAHNAFTVDVSAVTRGSTPKTNVASSLVLIDSVVTKELTIMDDATNVITYVAPFTISTTDGQVNSAAKTVNLNSASVGQDVPAKTRFEIICANSRSLGIYTVASATASAATTLVFEETIVADNAACTGAGQTFSLVLKSRYLKTNADLRNVALMGYVPKTSGESEAAGVTVTQNDNWVSGTGGYIFLGTDTLVSGLTTAFAVTGGTLKINGAGTSELTECSDRGVCDREMAICKCFKGYSGDACTSQNALSL